MDIKKKFENISDRLKDFRDRNREEISWWGGFALGVGAALTGVVIGTVLEAKKNESAWDQADARAIEKYGEEGFAVATRDGTEIHLRPVHDDPVE